MQDAAASHSDEDTTVCGTVWLETRWRGQTWEERYEGGTVMPRAQENRISGE